VKEAVMVTDPVCRMQIDEGKAVGKSEYGGKTYYFCAASCKKKFDENPQKYVPQ
jgi:YHS domain-containing protein